MSDESGDRLPPPRGAIRVARVFGIDVHLHWAWLVVAVLMIQWRADAYSTLGWNVAEYIALFSIVLLHEFGHALACRSVGGRADHVLLWPLGGVAYVRPPQRPGPTLWVSAAGPLVNVLLVPVTLGGFFVAAAQGNDDLSRLVESIAWINLIVLLFNILPVYPLDGGQMLRSVLWFFVGPHRSLVVATAVGLLGSAGFLALSISSGDIWLMMIAGFCLLSSWGGFKLARARIRASELERRVTRSCPSCGQSPPLGPCWPCPACNAAYDAFVDAATCPHCAHTAASVRCVFCGDSFPVAAYGGDAHDEPPPRPPETLEVTSYDVR